MFFKPSHSFQDLPISWEKEAIPWVDRAALK
jgi:hypothetical protein